ncbi:MAG: DUF4349 domain-containing protein [Microthrixaceae bacterium]
MTWFPPARRRAAGRVMALVGLAAVLGSCGNNAGVGLFGDFNGRMDIQTSEVADARNNVMTVVEKSHQGSLEKEQTEFPRKLLWVFGRDPESVLTFRVPAAEFDATMVDLDDPGIGTVVGQEVTGRDDIERRSDLSEVSQIIDDRLSAVIDRNGDDQEVVEAQERLADMADKANRPVLVVRLHPGRGFLDWTLWLLFNRILWLLLAFVAGLAFGKRSSQPKVSPVYAAEDERQNSPEKNPGVQDFGSPT